MKHVILASFLSLMAASSLSAQDAFRPMPGELGVGLKAQGFGPVIQGGFEGVFNFPTLQLRYQSNDRITFRLDIGIEGESRNTESRDTSVFNNIVTTTEQTTKVRQTGFTLSPGVEYHFEGTAKLDPYAGAQLVFGRLGNKKTVSEFDQKEGVTAAFNSSSEIVAPGTTRVGLQVFTGFNYFIADRFALGLEYSLGFLSKREGGKTLESSKSIANVGGVVTSSEFKRETFDQERTTEFKNYGVLSFNLVYFFGAF